jgi:hypothetical protein
MMIIQTSAAISARLFSMLKAYIVLSVYTNPLSSRFTPVKGKVHPRTGHEGPEGE